MKRFLILATILGLFSFSASAQGTRTVKGYVQDANTQALPNATVRAVSENAQTKSASDGAFELEVSTYCKYVEASFEGYVTAQAEIDGSIIIFRLNIDKKYASNKAKAEKAARAAADKDAAEKAKANEEAIRIAAQKNKAAEDAARKRSEEEIARLTNEKAMVEEISRLATEKANAAEAARAAAEKEVARLTAEKAKIEESARLATEKAKSEEAARIAAEKEVEQLKTEKAKLEESIRLAAQNDNTEELARLKAEKAKVEESARLAAEKAKSEEAARLAAEKEVERLKVEKTQAEENARLAMEQAKAAVAAQQAAEQKLAAAPKSVVVAQQPVQTAPQQTVVQQPVVQQAPIVEQNTNQLASTATYNETTPAQKKSEKPVKKNRFGQIIELGYFATSKSIQNLEAFDQGATLYYSLGGSFNNIVFLGVGTGLVWNIDGGMSAQNTPNYNYGGSYSSYYPSKEIGPLPLASFSIPAFLHLKVNMVRDSKVAPYIALMGGAEFSPMKETYNPTSIHSLEYNQTSVFGRVSLGLNFRIGKKASMYLGVGYRIDNRWGCHLQEGESYVYTSRYNVHGFTANLGFGF